jgi:hypothetical protein
MPQEARVGSSELLTNFNKAGSRMRVVIMREPMQIVRSFPMLAMPWWGEKESALKLRMVVRVLKKRALAVLVSSKFSLEAGSVRKRRTR